MKKNKKKSQKRLKRLIIFCIILIITLLIIIISLFPKKQEEQPAVQTVTEEEKAKEEKNTARILPEKKRIEYYIGNYMKNIENRDCKKNYEILAEKFKQNYFQTYEKYTQYVNKTYSKLIKVQYNDIQRQGNYYILDLTITNLGEFEDEINQKFVIYEDALMDYKLSFQVK